MLLNAKKGDESAIQTILNYYKGYMLELCKFELYDASGKIYICYDEDSGTPVQADKRNSEPV